MQNINIVLLVKDALVHLGCDPNVVGNIDDHSTISFDFDQNNSIYLSAEAHHVWLWSRIAEFNEQVVAMRGGDMLSHLMEPHVFLQTGHPALIVGEGYFEYKGLVHEDYLNDAPSFAAALQGFFDSMRTMTEIVLR